MIELPLLDPATVHRRTCDNGLRAIVRHDPSAPVVAIVTWVNAGYFDETDEVVGVAHVLEHMYFKGTPTRGVGEISRETKAAGGYLNAGTIYDHTSYYTVLPSNRFERGLEIQFDAYANSLIDDDELARELEVIIQETKRKADNPSAVTIETLYEVLHDHHRMRRWRMGREAGLRTFTREHVRAFYRTYYQPANTILVIAGDVEPERAFAVIERLHGSLPNHSFARERGPREPDRTGFRFRDLSGDVQQTQLALGFRTRETMHHDTAALQVASIVLGDGRASRLYRAVRECKLAASVSAFNYTPTELGVFVIHTEGPPETARQGLVATWEQLCDLRDGALGRDELWRARRVLESRWIRRLETMEGQANYLAEWEALGDWMMGERCFERLLTTEPEQVTDVIRRYLSLDRAALVAYRPAALGPIAADADELAHQLARVRPREMKPSPPRAARAPAVLDGTPPLEREQSGVRVYRTRRGVPILVRRRGGTRIAHLAVYALGGACEEEERAGGVTNLLVRAALKGTEHRTAAQLAEDAELLGGRIVSVAGADSFGWSISVPTGHAEAAIELLADVVLAATFPGSGFETERTLALAELALQRDDMHRYPMRMLMRAAFAGHPYGVPVLGTEESLGSLTPDMVRDWHQQRALQGDLVIGAVGDVDPDQLAGALARCFDSLHFAPRPPVEPPVWPVERIQVAEHRDKAQTALALAFPSASHVDAERHAVRLMAGVASGLGGRFFEQLRDRQSLAYTVTASPVERRLGGAFISYIATSPDLEEIAREGLLHQFARLRGEPVSDDELARAREFAIGTHAIRRQSGGALLGEMLDAWLLGTGLHEMDDYEAEVRSVTPQQMQAAAERYFDESRVVEAVVRGRG